MFGKYKNIQNLFHMKFLLKFINYFQLRSFFSCKYLYPGTCSVLVQNIGSPYFEIVWTFELVSSKLNLNQDQILSVHVQSINAHAYSFLGLWAVGVCMYNTKQHKLYKFEASYLFVFFFISNFWCVNC